jgi:two-component system chemotaxis response regulator CheB
VRVLIVEDSALVRRVLVRLLQADPEIEVVAAVPDAYQARDQVYALLPDVITLDLELQGVQGLTFLRALMAHRPTPVVVVSAFTRDGDRATLDAFEAGAFDVVAKPAASGVRSIGELGPELVSKVKTAAYGARSDSSAKPAPVDSRERARGEPAVERVVAIGASTGGPGAIRALLEALPADAPGLLIAQHMPARFTRSFAARCDQDAAVLVKEAEDLEPVRPGAALVAPGGYHLAIERGGPRTWRARVTDAQPVNRHRPSVDLLFASVARCAAPHALGVLLTGMGDDGANGLAAMRAAGCLTIAEDASTALVFGMPMEAIRRGAATETLPLPSIAPALVAWSRLGRTAHAGGR